MKGWTGFERMLLLFGSLLLSVYFLAQMYGMLWSRAELRKFAESTHPKASSLAQVSASGTTGPDFTLWSPQRIDHYKASLLLEVPKPLAVLQIPAIHLQVPVLSGTDDLTLDRGAGHIDGTTLPAAAGNIGIAGHRDGFFRGLQDIHVGDSLYLVAEGQTNQYVVDEILVVEPSDVSVLAPRSKPSITLVTCYPFYFVGSAPLRFIVHASLVTPNAKAEQARSKQGIIAESLASNRLEMVSISE
jgi:sortase A